LLGLITEARLRLLPTPSAVRVLLAFFPSMQATSDAVTLEREALLNLLRGTYRGERRSESTRVGTLDRLQVTLASDIVLFAPRAD